MPEELPPDDIHLNKFIRPGDTVIWTQGSGEPLTLLEKLIEQRHQIGKFRAFLGASYSRLIQPDHGDAISFIGLGGVGSNSAITKARMMDIIPCHLSELPRYFDTRAIPIDAALVQLSPKNASGNYTLATVGGYIQSAIDNARVVIGEINDQAPRTASRVPFDSNKLDAVVHVSRPLVINVTRGFTDTDRTIAKHIAALVPDGAVLQLGIGALPNALGEALAGHRDLGLHSGTLGDCVVGLIKSGVVTNARKPIDAGKTVTGTLIGSQGLYDFVHDNPDVLVEPVTYTHDPKILGQFECFVAINSAIEVDLTGQVNAEVIGSNYVGTIGGQTDFVRGALASPRGRSIMALNSIAGNGHSRIVSKLNGSVVTTSRADADTIVTEHGVAELRGKSIRERVRRMIAIAHPDAREGLLRDASTLIAGN
jgi:acetyl-CoA hydrolase